MRLIDADALKNELEARWNCLSDEDFANKGVWKALDLAPAVDAEPVRRGKWLIVEDENWKGGGRCECSVCHYGFSFGEYHEMWEHPRCPECGAILEVDDATV